MKVYMSECFQLFGLYFPSPRTLKYQLYIHAHGQGYLKIRGVNVQGQTKGRTHLFHMEIRDYTYISMDEPKAGLNFDI